jgi:hypothetical protein
MLLVCSCQAALLPMHIHLALARLKLHGVVRQIPVDCVTIAAVLQQVRAVAAVAAVSACKLACTVRQVWAFLLLAFIVALMLT